MSQREKRSFEILVRENTRMLTVFLRSRVKDEAAVDDRLPQGVEEQEINRQTFKVSGVNPRVAFERKP